MSIEGIQKLRADSPNELSFSTKVEEDRGVSRDSDCFFPCNRMFISTDNFGEAACNLGQNIACSDSGRFAHLNKLRGSRGLFRNPREPRGGERGEPARTRGKRRNGRFLLAGRKTAISLEKQRRNEIPSRERTRGNLYALIIELLKCACASGHNNCTVTVIYCREL